MTTSLPSAKRLNRLLPALLCGVSLLATPVLQAQLLDPPAIPAKVKRQKNRSADLEWMWQYSPQPSEGRQHELTQDAHFTPFLQQYFTAPQSFWGLQTEKQRKPLAATVADFMAVPGKVSADANRYITVTGAVFRSRTSRGLLFADLSSSHPLVVFAAVDWIRDSKTTDDPDAEYTLWLFPNQTPGIAETPFKLPPPLAYSITRWLAEPVPGTSIKQKITAAILVLPDGTPHQIPVPLTAAQSETAQ